MFRRHPKGLFVLFLSNMGERFGYYTMIAILALYLQDRFGWDETKAGMVYGWFLMGSYVTALLGGIIADTLLGYGKTIIMGLITMSLGYFFLMAPFSDSPVPIYIGLGVIGLGVGLFKGNLNVLVGNLYESKDLKPMRDSAFVIFYMGINVGAMFAPHAAITIKNFVLDTQGFFYDPALPWIAHQIINGATVAPEKLAYIQKIAGNVALADFSTNYINVLGKSYQMAFGISAIAMVFSLLIFVLFRKYYRFADYKLKDKIASGQAVKLSKKETNQRLLALMLVFLIVIFFWMAFHQNGSTLTFFARTYTNLTVGKFTSLLFYVPTILAIFLFIIGLTFVFDKKRNSNIRILSIIVSIASFAYICFQYVARPAFTAIDPALFQAFNPMFIVLLGPLAVLMFNWLKSKNMEPSTPAKIGIGMIITAVSFSLMLIPSMDMPKVDSLNGGIVDRAIAVSPYWLISTYFSITFAELFLSPIGISFVSKVAPPQMRGSMQAGWYVSTAVGNLLAGYVGRFYQHWELWQFFLLLVVLSLASAAVLFSLLGVINRASEEKE